MGRMVRRRTPSIGPIIVLLVLSHSVWNTLQCVTSPPNNQPSAEHYPKEEFNTRVSQNRSNRERLHQPVSSYFTRNSRPNTEDPNGESITFQLCHNRLTDALNSVCQGQYHDPNLDYSARTRSLGQALSETGRRTLEKRGEMRFMRRVPRSLVDECCKQKCTSRDVQKYCGFRNRPIVHQPEVKENERVIVIEPQEPSPMQSPNKVEIAEEQESRLLIPLLHVVSFLHKMYGPPTKSPSTLEDQRREPSSPQALVQDDPSISHISSSSQTHSGQSNLLGNTREHQPMQAGRNNGGNQVNQIPQAGREESINEETQTDSWTSPQRTAHHRGSGDNAYIASIPSQVIPLGSGTYDYEQV